MIHVVIHDNILYSGTRMPGILWRKGHDQRRDGTSEAI